MNDIISLSSVSGGSHEGQHGTAFARMARAYTVMMKVYLCQLLLIIKDITKVKFHFAICQCSLAASKKTASNPLAQTHTGRLVQQEGCSAGQGNH